jgi:hypothetical protein
MPSQEEIRENWPKDADDLVNGIPETVKAAKSMGHVPASGNDPDAQLRAAKALTAAGIEVPEGVQNGPVLPKDRRAAAQRQNEYAEQAAAVLEQTEGWNPVKAAAAAERGEDPADAAREDAAKSRREAADDTAKRDAEAAKKTAPQGRQSPEKQTS